MRALLTAGSGVVIAALVTACGGTGGDTASSASRAAPAASAPATTAAAASTPLAGTSWVLTTVAGATARPGGLLAFAHGGQLTGSTGCNDFGGSYVQDGSALTITMGYQTAKGCPGLEAQEAAVNAALPKTASFTSDGGTLTLLDASGAALLAYGHLHAASLVGRAFHVTGINNGKQAVSSPIAGTTVTATFAADGTVSGSAGCNTYSAAYTLTGNALKVQPPAATRKFCDSPAGVMEQETAFFNALEHSRIVEAVSTGVTLRDAGGDTQLTLAAPG